jgi:hypothetical protein
MRSPASHHISRTFLAVSLLLLPASWAAAQGGEAQINPDGYTSARVCGSCHTDIYDSWKNSLHAFALTDPIFDTAFMQAIKEGGDEAKRLCLRCHAPMTMENGDYDLAQGVSREGVSCDFCHTVTAVHLDRPAKPFSSDVSVVKRSVLRKAESPAHEVAFSELHGTSEFCGGCHNYKAASGASIMGTYDEWRNGPYAAEGTVCQDCHMVKSVGNVVRPEIKPGGRQIHLHNLIHDTDQIKSAVAVRIVNASRTPQGLVVDVEVENVGSGHMVPTGIPSRELVLTVTALAEGRSTTRQRRYRKVVADERSRPLEHDYEVFLRGAKVLNDNRIAPREKRLERFTFDPGRARGVKVTASVSYVYAPLVVSEKMLNIQLGEAERMVY